MSDSTQIQEISFSDHMKSNFLMYAEYVINDRALPSASDGLKPVQRRILQSMYYLGLHPNKAYKKCARTVGDTLGRLHPHGDKSVYDAMVKLAQEWKERYPLVDIHGNRGSVDGDSAAAMRYTEGRLAPIGELLMTDIDKDTVDMKPNYDESEQEAVELPGLFPTLLANGSTGIAVGMGSSFVPHRAIDIYNAVDRMIEDELNGDETSVDELISIIQAPDFPTGGIITNPNEIYRGYREGKGTVHIRSRYTIEEDKKGHQSIVITEIPYNVVKSKLIAKMDLLRKEGEIPDIKEIRDESNKEGIRIVIDIKKGGNEQFVVNKLLKKTEMAATVPMNHQALINGHVQERMTLKDLCEAFKEHAQSVVRRKSQFMLDKHKKRLMIVEGFLQIADDLMNAIKMITESESDEEVYQSFHEAYDLNREQVSAILARRIGSLKKIDQEAFEEEQANLVKEISRLTAITMDNTVLLQATREELKNVSQRFVNEKRLSEFSKEDALQEIADRDLVPLEDIVVTRSHQGLIKAVKLNDYNSQRRNGKGVSAKTQEDDFIEDVITLTNHDDLVFLTNIGKAYVIPAFRIPIVSKAAIGKYIQNYIPFEEGEHVINVFPMAHTEEMKEYTLFFATKNGICKRLAVDDLPVTKNGARIITIRDNDELVACSMVKDEDYVLLATKNGVAVKTSASNIRVMGRTAAGVCGIKFKIEGDEVVGAVRANDDDTLLIVAEKGIGKCMKAKEIRLLANKGGKGTMYYKISERTGAVKSVLLVNSDETVFVVSQNGMIIRIPADSIPMVGRIASGVRLVVLAEGDSIATVSAAPKPPEEQEDEEVVA